MVAQPHPQSYPHDSIPVDGTRMTWEAYLDLEEASELRWEYIDGCIYQVPRQEVYTEIIDGHPVMMAGATRKHKTITTSIVTALTNQFGSERCEAFGADERVKSGLGDHYYYPDMVAFCGEPEYSEGQNAALLNPVIVVEIVSKSSEYMDRGTKLWNYLAINSLQMYLVIAQDTPRVEVFSRGERTWEYAVYNQLDDVIELSPVEARLTLAEIYRRVAFSVTTAAAPEVET